MSLTVRPRPPTRWATLAIVGLLLLGHGLSFAHLALHFHVFDLNTGRLIHHSPDRVPSSTPTNTPREHECNVFAQLGHVFCVSMAGGQGESISLILAPLLSSVHNDPPLFLPPVFRLSPAHSPPFRIEL